MATKFLSFGAGQDEDLQMFTDRVQQAMTTIESKGGKYVDSHLSVLPSLNSRNMSGAIMMLVYEEGPEEIDLADFYTRWQPS